MSEQEAIRKGAVAESALRELDGAFDALKTAVAEELFATSPVHTDKILRLQAMGQAIRTAREAILSVVVHGQSARDALAATGMTRTGQAGR